MFGTCEAGSVDSVTTLRSARVSAHMWLWDSTAFFAILSCGTKAWWKELCSTSSSCRMSDMQPVKKKKFNLSCKMQDDKPDYLGGKRKHHSIKVKSFIRNLPPGGQHTASHSWECTQETSFPVKWLACIKLISKHTHFGTGADFCGSSFPIFLLQFRMEIKQAPVSLAKSLIHFFFF